MKYIILILIVFFSFLKVNAQNFKIFFQSGFFNVNKFDYLTQLDDYEIANLPFEVKKVINYPVRLNYEGGLLFSPCKRFELGFSYMYNNTGSKISRKDYSGEFYITKLIKSYNISLLSNYSLIEKEHFIFKLSFEIGVNNTIIDLKNYLMILNTISEESIKIASTNYFLSAGSMVGYKLKHFQLFLTIGYQKAFVNLPFHLAGNKDAIIIIPKDDNKVFIKWEGFKYGLMLVIPLFTDYTK